MTTTISVPLIAKLATDKLGLTKVDDGRLWRYDGNGRYRPDGLQEAEQVLLDELALEARGPHISELRTLVNAGRRTMPLSEANNRDYLNVRNGLYEWETGILHPHTSAHFYTYQVPHYWNPDAVCPRIDAFLERSLPDEGERNLWWAWVGYCLQPGNKHKKTVLLKGRKDAGKTVALHILTSILGRENVSAIGLQDINDHRFAVAEMVGKLANIADDISDSRPKESARFKSIVGNGAVLCEHKGGKPFPYTIEAKLIFSANDLPGTGDMSGAYFGRWHILPFDQPVPEAEQDRGIWAAVTSPEEMEGALVKAVAAGRELSAHGFVVPKSVSDAVEDYRAEADSVVGWLRECCDVRPTVFTNRKDAYLAFVKWAEAERRGVLGGPKFYNRLREAGVDEGAVRGVRGFRLRVLGASEGTTNPLEG